MGFIRTFIIVGGILATINVHSQEEEPVSKVVRPVKLMEMNIVNKRALSFPGEVDASHHAKLAFRVPGQIKKFHVKSGQMIKKGELLVELDPKDYEYMMLAEEAQFDLSKVKFARSEVLIKDFLISQESYDTDKSNMQVAESNYKTAQANLSYTKIFMPYDGIIANTYKENFESVQAQEAVLSIQADGAIDVVIDVPDHLISTLREQYRNETIKTKVTFALNSDVEYEATFKDISTVADKSTGSYEATLTLPKPTDINLYPGMAASGLVELNYDANLKVKIPESAFMRKDGKTMLWKYLPDSQTLTKISISTEKENEITSLLSHGDQIVVAGVNELSEGMKVKPWTKERGL